MQKKYQTLKVKIIHDKIEIITLSRPKYRNAWNVTMQYELRDEIERCNIDKNVKVIIITGDNDGNAFCAGMDMRSDELKKMNKHKRYKYYYRDGGGIAGLSIVKSFKPIIAAVNGHAIGVGITIPCCCDIRIGYSNAKISFAFVKRGLTCETISSYMLPKLVGLGKAQELILTGKTFYCKDSPNGLFNYIINQQDKVLSKAIDIAKEISMNGSGLSLALSRNMLIRNGNISPEKAHLIESKGIQYCGNNSDFREGVLSFLQKRKPNWKLDGYMDLPEWFPYWDNIATDPSKL